MGGMQTGQPLNNGAGYGQMAGRNRTHTYGNQQRRMHG